ncbi:hypothetical protein T07_7323 [Trichinella nelsoni]|uniref:Uncharacterized protein n=1 Tax=Trichinella nelsoni TaxID=6336 RepID=A0A0V0SBG2_9BILA|nr:hypothetical protein T07_7323 [Trichinella nelsoni]
MQGTITPWQAIPMTVSVPFTMGLVKNCMHTVYIVDFIDTLSSDIAAHYAYYTLYRYLQGNMPEFFKI